MSFSLSAQLQIQKPSNLGQIVSSVRNAFRGIDANINVNANTRQLKQINSEMLSISRNTKEATSAASEFGKVLGTAARRFGAISIATGTFLGITRAIKHAIADAIEFERELVKIIQATGASKAAIKSLSDEVLNLSSSMGVSSKDLVNAARTLAQAGFSATKTSEALKLLAQTELAATFDGIENTTEGVIAIIQQFGREAIKSGKEIEFLESSLDAINTVSKKFAVESSDIVAAVRKTGGSFEAAGGTLNELIALFTSVRSTTRESADTIATGFRTIFARIQRVDTIDKLKELGITLQDSEGKFIGPLKAIEALSTALSVLDTKDFRYSAIVEELGGIRQIGKIIPLIKQYAVTQDALNLAQKSSGELAKDAETAQGSLSVQIAKVRGEFQKLVTEFVDGEVFRAFAEGALGLASALIKVAKAIEPLIPLIAAFAAFQIGRALGPILGTVSGLRPANTGITGFATGGNTKNLAKGTDTVPAMLTPGEFIVRKSSVDKLGTNVLSHINKTGSLPEYHADGGVAGIKSQSKIGALILEPQSEINKRNQLSKKVQVPAVMKDRPNLDRDYSFELVRSGISDSIGEGFVNDVKTSFKASLTNAVNSVGEILNRAGIPNPIVPDSDKQAFLKSIGTGPIGSLFESVIHGINDKRFDKGTTDPYFDFIGELGPNVKKLFGGLDGIKYSDAKATINAASVGEFKKKARNQLVEESAGLSGLTRALLTNDDSILKGKTKTLQGLDIASILKLEKGVKYTANQLREKIVKGSVDTPYAITKTGIDKGGLEKFLGQYFTSENLLRIPGRTGGSDYQFLASGGHPKAKGTDTVPAMLTPGEFVVKKSSADKIGSDALHHMNRTGEVPKYYAQGGGRKPSTLASQIANSNAKGSFVESKVVDNSGPQPSALAAEIINNNKNSQNYIEAELDKIQNALDATTGGISGKASEKSKKVVDTISSAGGLNAQIAASNRGSNVNSKEYVESRELPVGIPSIINRKDPNKEYVEAKISKAVAAKGKTPFNSNNGANNEDIESALSKATGGIAGGIGTMSSLPTSGKDLEAINKLNAELDELQKAIIEDTKASKERMKQFADPKAQAMVDAKAKGTTATTATTSNQFSAFSSGGKSSTKKKEEQQPQTSQDIAAGKRNMLELAQNFLIMGGAVTAVVGQLGLFDQATANAVTQAVTLGSTVYGLGQSILSMIPVNAAATVSENTETAANYNAARSETAKSAGVGKAAGIAQGALIGFSVGMAAVQYYVAGITQNQEKASKAAYEELSNVGKGKGNEESLDKATSKLVEAVNLEAKASGSFAAGAGGALGGAAAGAIAGSFIPVIGTAIGALIGGIVGGLGGGLGGAKAGEAYSSASDPTIEAAKASASAQYTAIKATYEFSKSLTAIKDQNLEGKAAIDAYAKALDEAAKQEQKAVIDTVKANENREASRGYKWFGMSSTKKDLTAEQKKQAEGEKEAISKSKATRADALQSFRGTLTDVFSKNLTEKVKAGGSVNFSTKDVLDETGVKEQLERLRKNLIDVNGGDYKAAQDSIDGLTKQFDQQVEQARNTIALQNTLFAAKRAEVDLILKTNQALNSLIESSRAFTSSQENIDSTSGILNGTSKSSGRGLSSQLGDLTKVGNINSFSQVAQEAAIPLGQSGKVLANQVTNAADSIQRLQKGLNEQNVKSLKTKLSSPNAGTGEARKLLESILPNFASLSKTLQDSAIATLSSEAQGGEISPETIQKIIGSFSESAQKEADVLQRVAELTDQYLSQYSQANSLIIESMNKEFDARAGLVSIIERGSERLDQVFAKDATPNDKAASAGRKQAARTAEAQARLGGIAKAGDVKNLVANLNYDKASRLQIKDKLAGGNLDPKERAFLQAEDAKLANTTSKVTEELKRLTDQSARASDVMEQIAVERAKRDFVSNKVSDFVLGGQADRQNIAEQFQGVQSVAATGSFQQLPEDLRKSVDGLLEEMSAFDPQAKAVRQQAKYNDALSLGFSPQAAAAFAQKTPKEDKLIEELKNINLEEQAAQLALIKAEQDNSAIASQLMARVGDLINVIQTNFAGNPGQMPQQAPMMNNMAFAGGNQNQGQMLQNGGMNEMIASLNNVSQNFANMNMTHTLTVDGQISIPGLDSNKLKTAITEALGDYVVGVVRQELSNSNKKFKVG